MQCTSPIKIGRNLSWEQYPEGLQVPCGKCLACRIAKRTEWSVRMLHELEFHEDAIFLTLTYDDENIPEYQSLKKTDLQKFYKRLRKNISPRKIRHFSCGEYGDQTDRPHYHAIIFGMSLNNADKQSVIDSWDKCDWSPIRIKKSFGLAEPDSINYVAQYIDKKLSGDLAKQEYTKKNREPVFRLLSLGIGREYVDYYKDKLSENPFITIRGEKRSLPRYYINRLELDTTEKKAQAYQKECSQVATYTGLDYSYDESLKILPREQSNKLREQVNNARRQHNMNLQAKIAIKQSKL